jgi:hypothetical protein
MNTSHPSRSRSQNGNLDTLAICSLLKVQKQMELSSLSNLDEPHRVHQEPAVRRGVTPTSAGGESSDTAPLLPGRGERRTAANQRKDNSNGVHSTTTNVPYLSSTTDTTITASSQKKDLISSASEDGCSPPRFPATGDDYNDEDEEESVQSIQRIMCPRAASFGSVKKRMGGRWDTNLMEDSMPGLVSFSHGSYSSLGGHMNGSSFSTEDDDFDVSSLECSFRTNSQHSKNKQQQQHAGGVLMIGGILRNQDSSVVQGGRGPPPPLAANKNVLQPLVRVATPDGKHQEVRWSEGGELHCSSDSMPTLSRRPRSRD